MNNIQIKRFAVLCSGSGALFWALINAVKRGDVHAKICSLIAGAQGIHAIELARQNGIPYFILDKRCCKSDSQYDESLLEALTYAGADFAVTGGFLNIIGANTVARYKNKIINAHPSLMYKFCGKGYYGKAVHKAVIAAGAVVSGATVHLVDGGVDTGPIILQKSLVVRKNDTVDTLSIRVLQMESRLLVKAASLMAEDKILVSNGRVKIGRRS